MSKHTVQFLLQQYQLQFPDASTAKLDAEILISFALGKSKSWLKAFFDQPLSDEQVNSISELCERRMHGEPVAYILGEWEFYSLPFKVTPDTLIPRPETELLVDRSLEIVSTIQSPNILDLGTGTGAIAVAIKANCPQATVTAVEFSEGAYQVAKNNIVFNQVNVHLLQGSWYEPLTQNETFNLIVSNPPYVAFDDPHLTQGDLPFEPMNALTAGEDEFADIRHILKSAPHYLSNNGYVLIEHGYNQKDAVQQLFSDSGFKQVKTHKDYSGQYRFTEGLLIT